MGTGVSKVWLPWTLKLTLLDFYLWIAYENWFEVWKSVCLKRRVRDAGSICSYACVARILTWHVQSNSIHHPKLQLQQQIFWSFSFILCFIYEYSIIAKKQLSFKLQLNFKYTLFYIPVYIKSIRLLRMCGGISCNSILSICSSTSPVVNIAWKYRLLADRTARWAWN